MSRTGLTPADDARYTERARMRAAREASLASEINAANKRTQSEWAAELDARESRHASALLTTHAVAYKRPVYLKGGQAHIVVCPLCCAQCGARKLDIPMTFAETCAEIDGRTTGIRFVPHCDVCGLEVTA